jgi:acetyl esterase
MTEETKKLIKKATIGYYVAKFMNVATTRLLYDRKYDIRKVKEAKFDGLVFEEHLVPSDYDGYKIPVTVYIPKNKNPETPIGVLIHGGCFQFGSRRARHATACYITDKADTMWVSVEYRLSPEFKYPTALNDCISVTRWVINNKQNLFQSSPNAKVGVCGDSAGGNLAALVALGFRDQLAFQILIYPFLDLTCSSALYEEFSGPIHTNRELTKRYVADYVGDRIDPKSPAVSPLFQTDFSNLPKTLVFTAELDALNEEGTLYFEKLQNANVPCEIRHIKGVLHGFFHYYEPKMNAFKEAVYFLIEFLRNL